MATMLPIEMSPISSRAPSIYATSLRSEAPDVHAKEDLKAELMVNYLRQRQVEKVWCDSTTQFEQGVVLRRRRDEYVCKPVSLAKRQNELYDQIRQLNVRAAMTIRTEVITTFLENTQLSYVPFTGGLRIQMLPDITSLSRCKKHQLAAFVQEPPMLIVWHEDPNLIIAKADEIQSHLIQYVWNGGASFNTSDEKHADYVSTTDINDDGASDDLELQVANKPRKTVLYQAFLTAMTGALVFFCISIGASKLAVQISVDKNYVRLALLIFAPAQIWVGWFFFQSLINGIAQIIGPVNQVENNSVGYSTHRTKRLTSNILPHVTIQAPVYKEGLWTVIDPTMASIRAAISTYEMQGGSANVFVNDDGMQLLSSKDAEERRSYYEEHNIGWVARPKHNPRPTNEKDIPFIRPGKFKKASNMNYAMNVSTRVEDKLHSYFRGDDWTDGDEEAAYKACLSHVIDEDGGRTWAEGDIRFGDYILIIDSDTRLPADSFLDLVSEMEASPQVAIIQVSSGVMNVTTSFFEKGITYFTNLVYTAIQYAVANGDVAFFVGHNAIIRWSALQDIRYEEDNVEKYWSETTVSEDFDLALRLQAVGYDLRFCTYFKGGFKEGVSLTVYDEIARWEKYAYGCSELVFQPFIYWPTRGPFTPLFRNFIGSRMSIMAKMTIMSYIATYYALGSTWLLTLANYFLIGWANGHLDQYYFNSFNIFFSIIVVFQALGTVSLAVLRYRIADRTLMGAFLENLTWLPLVTVFLGGISMHVFQALASHMFSINMSWGATSKEETKTTFFSEIPTIIKKFKFTFGYCLVIVATMITMAGVGPLGAMVPPPWRITEFVAIFPLSTTLVLHFMMPLVLNPGLMQFSF